MKESNLEKDCYDLAEMMGWVVYKGFGRNGAPDKIFLRDGRGFTVEMKLKKGKQSLDQKNEEIYIAERGVPYYIVRSLQDFRNVILNEEEKFP